MAQITTLSVTATPGRVQSFGRKIAEVATTFNLVATQSYLHGITEAQSLVDGMVAGQSLLDGITEAQSEPT